jgi:type I restriction enzyme R subunit
VLNIRTMRKLAGRVEARWWGVVASLIRGRAATVAVAAMGGVSLGSIDPPSEDRVDKRDLSERDICTKFITPAIEAAGWDIQTQVREEVSLTAGRVIVRGKLVSRGKSKRADYVLYLKPNVPLAVLEAKDNNHSVGDGMQQALDGAVMLDVPYAISSNGDGFLIHDRSASSGVVEREVSMDDLPSPEELWAGYKASKGI